MANTVVPVPKLKKFTPAETSPHTSSVEGEHGAGGDERRIVGVAGEIAPHAADHVGSREAD